MKILAIDTSGDSCSAALLCDSALEQRLETEPRRHGELVLGMMDELLAGAGIGLRQLDALAFGRGPGSFTGVRIATSVIQGAAFGADLPVVPVSTLAALAQGHFRNRGEPGVLAALDALMGEIYWGPYELGDGGFMALAGKEEVGPPEVVRLPEEGRWSGIGSGWSAHGDVLRRRLGPPRFLFAEPEAVCQSRDIAVLAAAELAAGNAIPAERALPVYLRDRVTAAP